MKTKIVGALAGSAFGFVLAWSRVTDPEVIRRMLLLMEADVFLLMGAAVLVAAAGIRLLRAFRFRALVTGERINWVSTPIQSRHMVGSALFGAGWSVACTCPGPVAAMIGQGHLAGLVVAAGLLSGIAIKHGLDRHVRALPASNASQAAGL
jgi:uncharacterized protein